MAACEPSPIAMVTCSEWAATSPAAQTFLALVIFERGSVRMCLFSRRSAPSCFARSDFTSFPPKAINPFSPVIFFRFLAVHR